MAAGPRIVRNCIPDPVLRECAAQAGQLSSDRERVRMRFAEVLRADLVDSFYQRKRPLRRLERLHVLVGEREIGRPPGHFEMIGAEGELGELERLPLQLFRTAVVPRDEME